MMQSVLSVKVLRNIRQGDVVWVTVRPDMAPDEMDVLREVLASGIVPDATVLVTRSGFLEKMESISLAELLMVQRSVEQAIQAYGRHHSLSSCSDS